MVLWLVLSQTNATEDPVAWLINLGVAGIVIMLLITGKLRTGKEVEHLLEEISAKDDLIAAFQSQLTGSTLPALARGAQALESIPTSEGSLYRELQRTQQEVTDLTRTLKLITNAPRSEDEST